MLIVGITIPIKARDKYDYDIPNASPTELKLGDL
jgi:hypothetical protein